MGVYFLVIAIVIITKKEGEKTIDIFTGSIWIVTILLLIFSVIKDRNKTKRALRMGFGMGKSMMGSILAIVFSIGILLTFFPPDEIAAYVAGESTMIATLASAAFGTITLIPAFIAFPLVGSLVQAGVSIVPAVAFLTTLTMVGFVTFPLEKREFGLKFAITRNVLSFIFAILIALAMGVIL